MTAILVTASVTLMAAGGVRAESIGAYKKGTMRVDDENLIVCKTKESAIEIASALNETYLRTRNHAKWAEKLEEMFAKFESLDECFFLSKATHFLIRTVYEGSVDLKELDKKIPNDNYNMNVVATSIVEDDELLLGYIPTLEVAPPVE